MSITQKINGQLSNMLAVEIVLVWLNGVLLGLTVRDKMSRGRGKGVVLVWLNGVSYADGFRY